MSQVRSLLEERFPGLHARIENALSEAEARFNKSSERGTEFLLEHSRRTAALALYIARLEGAEPFLPSLVALFHDAGKFHGGEYHKDDIPEEEHAAVLAGRMLANAGASEPDIDAAQQALRALYADSPPFSETCKIVRDADQLDKLGALGVGAFFTKAALRGRGLMEALVQTLSRELTYAHAAPRVMFTNTGRVLARQESTKTVAFFESLLDDLARWGVAAFERRTLMLEEDFRKRDGSRVRGMEVTIVLPSVCPQCEGELGLTHARGRGLKCEMLTACIACRCGYARKTSFCLPVFA